MELGSTLLPLLLYFQRYARVHLARLQDLIETGALKHHDTVAFWTKSPLSICMGQQMVQFCTIANLYQAARWQQEREDFTLTLYM
jgi:hypothetical protein